MHSWELVQQRQNSLLIAVLLPPPLLVSIDWAFAWGALQKPPSWDVTRVTGLPWGEARTQAAYDCLNRGHQFLFFLDADVLAPPDTILRLMAHRLPVVSALYKQRFPTWTGFQVKYMPCMFNEGRDAQGNPVRVEVSNFQYGQLVEAHFVPAGCLLIHRSVFERFLAAGIKRFFQWTMNVENPQGSSEDFFFTRKCWDVGYKVIVDTGIQAIHEVPAKVDMEGLSAKI